MICLDSTIIIDFLNGRKEAIDLIEQNQDSIATTEISVLEVFYGIYIKKAFSLDEENEAREFFNSIHVLPMKQGCGKIAAEILAKLFKEGKIIEQNDAIIISIMLKNGIDKIITKNKKHFDRVKGIKVISY